MSTVFRSIDFWKSAVMTLPDNSFFELLRSVFGKIKTPFKKQQLVNDLETFLLREDIQKTIAAYIDRDDAKVIAAVALFGEPAPGELESFFSGELSYAQLQDIIVNLEERFILYRFHEEKLTRLALNPALEQVLLPFAADTSSLFPAESAGKTKSGSCPAHLNDRVLAGLLSFAAMNMPFFKSQGVIKKKVLDAAKTCFPATDLELVTGSLQVLGLFYADEDKLLPDKKYLEDFGSLSAQERSEYYAAAMLAYKEIENPAEILPPLFRSRIRDLTNFIHAYLETLDAALVYPEQSLKRLAEVLNAKTEADITSCALLDVLEKTGLVAGGRIVPREDKSETHEGAFITIDSGSSILVYPEISFDDLISLASFLSIKEAGAVTRFDLDRDSAVRAFDSHISADEIAALLKRLSCNKVSDTLIWNLKDWEKRHGEVALKKGVVLTLTEDRRYIVETKALSDLITETLAPGVYLLPEDALDEAAEALSAAGIDIIARPGKSAANNTAAKQTQNHFPKISTSSASPVLPQTVTDKPQSAGNSGGTAPLIENFHAVLEKMQLDKAARTELSARIDRRLILCESQLKEAVVRYEKLEARLLDYAGKQNIAKQAISQQSPVEVEWSSGKKIYGIPKALEKEGTEHILVLAPAGSEKSSPTEPLRIPLAKISLLRRIKKSIFET
jgi:hypothetical protein